MTKLTNALREREEFLKKHPKLRFFQTQIDQALNSGSTYEERMDIIKGMMMLKCKEMSETVAELRALIKIKE